MCERGRGGVRLISGVEGTLGSITSAMVKRQHSRYNLTTHPYKFQPRHTVNANSIRGVRQPKHVNCNDDPKSRSAFASI